MAENNSQSNSQEQQPEQLFSQEQYDMLKRCSDKEDMTEWNEWRKKNAIKDIKLYGQSFYGFYLKGIYFNSGSFFEGKTGRKYHFSGKVYLENANFNQSHLEEAYFHRADLTGSNFASAHLEHSILYRAILNEADFRAAIVDGETSLVKSKVSRGTNFVSVGLNNLRIDPGTKQLLEYNIRRMNWEEWYEKHEKLKWLVKPFWLMSDYGMSTGRIILTFFALAIIFATVYFIYGAYDYYLLGTKEQPGIVKDLFVSVTQEKPMSDVYYGAMIYFRAVYFSVVTMTTLGFGDMYANTASYSLRWWIGHLLLIMQVILGYVLLAALVTRFAVLFTAGGPAGEFTEKEQKSEQRQ